MNTIMNENINFEKYEKRRKRLFRTVMSRILTFLLIFAIGAIIAIIFTKNAANWNMQEKDVKGVGSLIMLATVAIGFLSQFWQNGQSADIYEAAVISKVLPHFMSKKMNITKIDAKHGFDKTHVPSQLPVGSNFNHYKGSAYFSGTIEGRSFEYARVLFKSESSEYVFSSMRNTGRESKAVSRSYHDVFSGMLLRTDMPGEDFIIYPSHSNTIMVNQNVCMTGNDGFDSRFICYSQSVPSCLNEDVMNAINKAGEVCDSPLYIVRQDESLWLIYDDCPNNKVVPSTEPFTEEFFIEFKEKTDALVDIITEITASER